MACKTQVMTEYEIKSNFLTGIIELILVNLVHVFKTIVLLTQFRKDCLLYMTNGAILQSEDIEIYFKNTFKKSPCKTTRCTSLSRFPFLFFFSILFSFVVISIFRHLNKDILSILNPLGISTAGFIKIHYIRIIKM